jgi:hypothetical protein
MNERNVLAKPLTYDGQTGRDWTVVHRFSFSEIPQKARTRSPARSDQDHEQRPNLIHSNYQHFVTMAPTYTLHSPAGSFRAFAPLIAAEYNGVNVNVDTEGVEAAVAAMSPTGKAPILETPTGVIFSSAAMARYVAGLRRDTGLLGNSLQEQAAVDSWMDWCAQDIELPACVWWYPVAGYMPSNEDA